jgi:hypothetical protein
LARDREACIASPTIANWIKALDRGEAVSFRTSGSDNFADEIIDFRIPEALDFLLFI